MKRFALQPFIIALIFACALYNESFAQYPSPGTLRAEDLIKILNTDNRSTITQFLKNYGFAYSHTNGTGEYFVYYDKGKMSTEYGLSCIILGKGLIQKKRQLFYITPYSSVTNNLMSDLSQLGFKTYGIEYDHDYPTGSYISAFYNARFITIDTYDQETSEKVYYSSLSLINGNKEFWK
ncbi:hypothetical protein JYG30_04035 [Fibrella sp. USSR17]